MILAQLVVVVATLGAADLSQLGYANTAIIYGAGVEYHTSKLSVEFAADYSPARKTETDKTWSTTAGLSAWKAFGSDWQLLVGGGASWSHLDAGSYRKDSYRCRIGSGGQYGGARLTIDWLAPLSDDNRLRGLEMGFRYDYGHLRVGVTGAAYQFDEPVGPTRNARAYGAYLGGTF